MYKAQALIDSSDEKKKNQDIGVGLYQLWKDPEKWRLGNESLGIREDSLVVMKS